MTTGENRRTAGVALLASGAVMFVASALCFTGVLPVPIESRTVVGGVVALAALADVLIGVRFMGSSE
jgi:hypothetical protein